MAVCVTQDEAAREAWLRERRNVIGASEVGTILGLTPYASPYSLWAQKVGLLPEVEETLPMWFGRKAEPIIAERYEIETGRRLIDKGDYWTVTHPDYSWLRATPDRLVSYGADQHGAVELKTIGARNGGDWDENTAPLTYDAQLQIQLACLGYDRGEIAAMIGNNRFLIIERERNDDFLDTAYPVLHEFWQCVQTGEPPSIDGTEATARALKKLHPLDNGEVVEVSDAIAKEWHEAQEMKGVVRELEECIARRENQIRAAIGDNTYAEHCGTRMFSYKTQTRAGYLRVPTDHAGALVAAGVPFTETQSSTYRVLRKAGSK